ncbi:hypothetical protein PM082_024933 [Marasmius tenuissimus]|nr:hypothetical protein PM082_024933 [Marasmius tenuissimus]
MDYMHNAQTLVDTRFIETLFEIPPAYFAQDESEPIRTRMSTRFARMLDCISRVLVYQLILRQFIRKMRRIRASDGLEERPKTTSIVVWEAWQRVTEKAYILYSIHRTMKAIGLWWNPKPIIRKFEIHPPFHELEADSK